MKNTLAPAYKRLTRSSRAIIFVFLAWVFICLLGALPYYFSGFFATYTDAVFESVSGFTTTGSTVMQNIEAAPGLLLFWRALTQWLGGMGIVLLTVALLPLLGAEGFQLFKAEAPGPEKEKITPRITFTARFLWLIYAGMTVIETLLLRFFGMTWFDALLHSFSTISTGGFSPRNSSVAAYNSPGAEWICILFMFLSGFNFSLIWQMLRGKIDEVLHNSEAKAYTIITIACGIFIAGIILPGSSSIEAALRNGFFNVTTILTTTGFANAGTATWHPLAQTVLFFLMFLGGCSGSTAGGVKIIRYIVLAKQAGNEMKKIIYPKGVFNLQLNGKSGKKDMVYGVAGFIFLYFLLIFLAAMLVSSAGEDIFSSVNVSLLCLGNIGIGLGKLGPFTQFPNYPAYVKWGLSITMIIGRLELWTVLVFLTRDFWRR